MGDCPPSREQIANRDYRAMDRTSGKDNRSFTGFVGGLLLILMVALLGVAASLVRERFRHEEPSRTATNTDEQISDARTDAASQELDSADAIAPIDAPTDAPIEQGDTTAVAADVEPPAPSQPTTSVDPQNAAESAAGGGPDGARPEIALQGAEPWAGAFRATGDPPDALDVCFGDFAREQSVPRVDELREWFSTVPGQRSEIKQNRTQFGDTAWIEGLVRLQMPWREDVALRLSLWDCRTLQVHLFHETGGLTLAYHERNSHRWGAYRTERKPGAPKPETFTLVATDQSRGRRAGFRRCGTIELRCGDGQFVLSRGDIVLLRAPLESVPDEVYLEGRAAVVGIAAVRSGGFPPVQQARPAVLETDRPAELAWVRELVEGQHFEPLADGSVCLTSDRSKASGWVATPIADGGLREVVLELTNVTRGSGVFLAREDGRPHEIVRLVRDRRSDRTCVSWQSGETTEVSLAPIQEAIVPLVDEHLWIRLVFGCGMIRYWISCDGVHWAHAEQARGGLTGPVTHVGLHCLRNVPDCRITMRRLVLRRFAAIESLGDPDVADSAPSLHDSPNIGVWLTSVTESQPEAIELGVWRRSCAVRTLAAGCRRDLGNALVDLLVRDAADRGLPWEQQLDLLADAALQWDTDGDYHLAHGMLDRYHELGLRLFRSVGLPPFSSVRRAAMSISLPTNHDVKSEDEQSLRAELLQLVYANRWRDLVDFCDQVRYFRQESACRLIPWAEAMARRRTPRQARSDAALSFKSAWQQPLIEEWNKDIYNLSANLDSLLDSEAYSEAANMVAAIEPHATSGVTPSVADDDLFLSLPTVVAVAMLASPELRRAVDTDHGAAAKLRVQRAMRENDLAVIQMATIQFPGSEAASEAHRWLGDRALAAGWFANAMIHYQRAATSCAIADRPQLAARWQLAAAMLGRRVKGPESDRVQFGTSVLSVNEFESLIADLLEHSAADGESSETPEPAGRDFPQPSGFTLQQRGRFDGPVGAKPEGQLLSLARRFQLNWVGRQIATAVDRDTLYVSNRFHITAYDSHSGARRWQGETPSGEPMHATEWPLVPMQPLLTSDRLFARMLYDDSPRLVCLDRADGRLQWTAELAKDDAFVSDPFMLQGQLAALTLSRNPHGGVLRLTIIADRDGQIISRHDLARISEAWWRRPGCPLAVLDDGFIAVLSGLVLAGDAFGNVRWMRRTTVLPAEEDPTWLLQSNVPPVVDGDRLYVAQVGVRTVQCLDIRSGRQIWAKLVPDVKRVVGISAGHLILDCERGLSALDPTNGDPVWLYAIPGSVVNIWLDDSTVFFAGSGIVQQSPQRHRTEFVWLDARVGRAGARTLLDVREREQPLFGPVVLAGEHLWALSGNDEKDLRRDLLELTPQGEPSGRYSVDLELDPWVRHVPDSLQLAAGHMFPGWRLLSAERIPSSASHPADLNTTDVLSVRAERDRPSVLIRHTTIPAGGTPRLRLRLANAPRDPCVVEVRFNGASLFREDVRNPRTDERLWRSLDVDLSPVVGKTGWLVVEAGTAEHRTSADIFWQQVDIVY